MEGNVECECTQAKKKFSEHMFEMLSNLKPQSQPFVLNMITRNIHSMFSPSICIMLEKFIGSIVRNQLTGAEIDDKNYRVFDQCMTEFDKNPLLYRCISHCLTENAQKMMEINVGDAIRKQLGI